MVYSPGGIAKIAQPLLEVSVARPRWALGGASTVGGLPWRRFDLHDDRPVGGGLMIPVSSTGLEAPIEAPRDVRGRLEVVGSPATRVQLRSRFWLRCRSRGVDRYLVWPAGRVFGWGCFSPSAASLLTAGAQPLLVLLGQRVGLRAGGTSEVAWLALSSPGARRRRAPRSGPRRPAPRSGVARPLEASEPTRSGGARRPQGE